jgi:SNF2 family DNA or RNA helicase
MIYTPQVQQTLMTEFLLTHDRAALFCGMGLGKSAAVLAALREEFVDGGCKGALIVAPLRVAILSWPNELQKWDEFRCLKYEVLRGQQPSGKSMIYLTNYEQLPKLTDLSFCDTIIYDEITRAKNPASERINEHRKHIKGHRRWGLTGTPRPNNLLELFAQVRLLDDGQRLGRSFHQFRNTWCHATDYMEYNWAPNPGAEEAIYKRIRDLALTLRTSDYSDQPDLVVEDIEVKLPDAARGLYHTLEKELLISLGPKGDVVALNAAVLVNKLLQVTGGTVYNETRGAVEVHDAKIRALQRLLAGMPGENVIVFTNFIHERERVCKAIGGTNAADFVGDIETAWNSGKIKYLVADPRSLGHGLNLQAGGKTIVWFSPNWSRESYDQANARVWRKGQKDVSTVYRLLCPQTMDDVVVETLRTKEEGQSAMLALLTNFRRQGLCFTT